MGSVTRVKETVFVWELSVMQFNMCLHMIDTRAYVKSNSHAAGLFWCKQQRGLLLPWCSLHLSKKQDMCCSTLQQVKFSQAAGQRIFYQGLNPRRIDLGSFPLDNIIPVLWLHLPLTRHLERQW